MKVTMSVIHKAALMLRVLLLASPMIATAACAQTPATQGGAEAVSDIALALPDALIGTWRPYSRGYQQFGDLQIGREILSWGFCNQVRYRVFRKTGDAHYIEQTGASPCDFSIVGTRYLVLVLDGKDLQVSICRDRDEFDRPPTQKYCSWGILNKLSDETPDASSDQ